MNNYLNEFNGYLSVVKKASSNTVQSYNRDISSFCEYALNRGIDDTAHISNDFVQEYIDALLQDGNSAATVSRKLSSLKCYYRFLVSLSKCGTLPTDGVTVNKKDTKKLPVILEQAEVLKLLAAPDIGDYKGIRDKAMLELLYATGIKVSELIALKIENVDLQIGIIKLETGTSRERVLPVYDDALHTLSLYIHQVRPSVAATESGGILFTNMNGLPLTRQGVWKIMKSYSEAAGIKKDITPNTLRHSFAAHLLENGADINDIKQLLGHTDISSTKIYSKIIKNKYAAAYRQFHPLARH